jgi:molybdate transport system substrate-binding protein
VRSATRTTALVLTMVSALALAGCGSDDPKAGGSTSDTSTLTVLGAASLTGTFGTLAKDFEAEHPGVTVRLAFDSSATLAEQVNQGAPADVLATADESTMQTVVEAKRTVASPRIFATNHLQLVVPRDNPARIRRFSDIARSGVKYVVCVDTAPCGKLAKTVLAATGISAEPASEEVDVKAVLSKVQLDEADAGLVYATDAVAGGDKVTAIDIPTANENLNSYPIAALKEAEQPSLAKAFVSLVLSAKGQQVLADAGFGRP